MARFPTLPLALVLATACGAPADDVTDEVDDTDATDTEETNDTEDTEDTNDTEDTEQDEAPRIVSMIPAKDALGVLPDATIELRFNVPMDTASVEDALTSVVLGEGLTFSWPDSKRLVITPDEDMPVRSWDPEGSQGAEVDIGLGAAAMSEAGVPMDGPYWASFRVAQSYSATIRHDDALTGRVNALGEATTSAFQVGDTSGGTIYRAFATFDLEGVPEILGVRQVVYGLDITTMTGSPFESLGTLQLHAVRYAALSSAYGASTLGPATAVAKPDWNSHVLIDITDSFEAAAADRATEGDLVQFRLAFTITTDGDDGTDYAIFQKNAEGPELAVDLLVE